MLLWRVWTVSKQYRRRPSELLNVTNDFDAFCLDEAVMTFGTSIDGDVQEAADNTKGSDAMKRGAAENTLRKHLGLPLKFATPGASKATKRNRPEGWE